MSIKDDYVEKLKAQLDEWSADIDAFEERAQTLDAEVRAKAQGQLVLLRAKRDDARRKLKEIQDSAGDAWLELRKGGDEAWESIKHALIEARKKFGS